jgi:Flp pilus assembly protein TadG
MTPPAARLLHRLGRRDDRGNAMIEFVYLSVLLMVPLVYLLTTVFQVQRAAFGVTEAARQAGRAYATAETGAAGAGRASAAASLALGDQGLVLAEPVEVSAPDGLAPGAEVRVVVRHRVVLPLVGGLFRGAVPPSIPVQASHLAVVDRFQDP